jgi:single-strand DNA-binding protein
MNKAILVGRLTKDPELKTTGSGVSVCSFTLAINRRFKNAEGGYDADFINCVAWRQQAEFISKYFSKGRMVGISGSIQTRSYDREDGQRVYITEVVADEVSFVDSKSQSDSAPSTPAANNTTANSFGADDGFIPMPADDDLPF